MKMNPAVTLFLILPTCLVLFYVFLFFILYAAINLLPYILYPHEIFILIILLIAIGICVTIFVSRMESTRKLYLECISLNTNYISTDKKGLYFRNNNVQLIYDYKLHRLNIKDLSNPELNNCTITMSMRVFSNIIEVPIRYMDKYTNYNALYEIFMRRKSNAYQLLEDLRYLDNKYFKKNGKDYYLHNKNVILKYDRYAQFITIHDLLNEDRFYAIYDDLTSNFAPLFEIIAQYFNNNTDCDTLLIEYFKGTNKRIVEYKYSSNDKEQQNKKINNIKNRIPIMNINNISEKELSKLPGINIATAKKAVKYRQEKSGFKSKEEFYKILKLKQRYIEIMDSSIIIGKYEMLNEYSPEEVENKPQEGRQIDF